MCEITNEEFKLENPITDDEDEVQMTNEFPEVQRTNALPEPIIKPIGSLVANYSSSDDGNYFFLIFICSRIPLTRIVTLRRNGNFLEFPSYRMPHLP